MAIKASIHSEGWKAESNQQQEVQQQEKQVEAYELLFIGKRAFPLPASDGGMYSLIMVLIKVSFINPTNLIDKYNIVILIITKKVEAFLK